MKANVTIKSLLAILLVALLIVTPVLFWRGFLCFEGFLSGMAYYGIILIGLAILRTGATNLTRDTLESCHSRVIWSGL